MKIMNRLAAVILILTLFCVSPVLAAGASQNDDMTDAELLYALAITNTKPTADAVKKVVTRAEFTAMLLKACALPQGGALEQIFRDVPAEHSYYNEIGMAHAVGIIKGNGTGMFKPEDPIVYEQAVVMIINALGCGAAAENKGGYFTGYLTIGKTMGIANGVQCMAGDILRYGTACRLIANALEAEMITEQGFDADGNVIGRTEKGVTLFTERLKVEKREGIVSGNEVTMLTKGSSLNEGVVEIGGVKYEAGKSGAENLLGCKIVFYVDVSDLTREIKPILYAVTAKNNEKLTIKSKDILPGTDLTTSRLPYLDKDNREKKADISRYADLIYNGVSVGGFTKEDFVPADGEVELIDNNYDGIYDVVKVWDYETIFAEGISELHKTVYDKYDGKRFVSFDNDGTAFIYKDGERVSFDTVGKFDVLSVAKSRPGIKPHVTAYVSSQSVSGRLQQMSDDGIYIDDIFYDVAPSVQEQIAKLGVGTQGTFFLDAFGRIAGFDDSSRLSEKVDYGYIIAAETSGSLEQTVRIKLLTSQSSIEVLDCAKKLMLDGNTITVNGSNVMSALRASATAKDIPGSKASDTAQIVRYSLNADNQIKMLDTLSGNQDDSNDNDMLSWDAGKETKRRKYMRTARMIGGETAEIALDENTVCFKIPAAGYEDDEEQYMAGSVGLDGNGAQDILYPSKDYDVDIWGYDLNEVKVAGAVIVVSDGAKAMTEADSMVAMVSKIVMTADEEGQSTYKLSLVKGRKITDYILTEAELIDPSKLNGKSLAVGDVIFCKKNAKNEIVHVEKILVDMDTDAYKQEGLIEYQSYFYAKQRLIYGYIEEKKGRNLIMVADDPSNALAERYPCMVEDSAPVAVYSKKRQRVEFTSVGELSSCVYNNGSRDKVILISATGAVTDAYIIREE